MKGGHRTDIRAVRGLGLRETPLSIVRLLWVPAGKSEALASLWWPQNSGSFFGGGGAVVPVGSSLREARVAEPPPPHRKPFYCRETPLFRVDLEHREWLAFGKKSHSTVTHCTSVFHTDHRS